MGFHPKKSWLPITSQGTHRTPSIVSSHRNQSLLTINQSIESSAAVTRIIIIIIIIIKAAAHG